MPRWQAIVFDLDDTLYPERDYVLSGFKAVAHWAGEHLGISLEQGFSGLKALFENGVRGDTFSRWLADHGLEVTDRVISQLVHVYRAHLPELRPFLEVPALLEAARRHCRLGIVSDGYITVQQNKWAALHLAGYFDAVVFSDQWGRSSWKPSIKPFAAVLELLGSDATRSIYIGDNPLKDFFGPRKLSMFTVRVRYPNGEYADRDPPTDQHAPDLTFCSLSELAEFVAEIIPYEQQAHLPFSAACVRARVGVS